MTDERQFEGDILRLRCRKCEQTSVAFEFSGDSDMVTDGLCSASGCNDTEVVVFETTSTEWNALGNGDESLATQRLMDETKRSDLSISELHHVERKHSSERVLGVLDFVKAYEPPVLVYRCPCCRAGDAVATDRKTATEFVAAGGTITSLGRLKLRNT